MFSGGSEFRWAALPRREPPVVSLKVWSCRWRFSVSWKLCSHSAVTFQTPTHADVCRFHHAACRLWGSPTTALLTCGDNPSVGCLSRLLRGFAACLIIPPPLQQLVLQCSDTRANPSRHYNTDSRCNFSSLMKCFQHARFHHFLLEARRG